MKFIFIQIKLLIIFLLLLNTINAQTTFSTQSISTCKEYLWPINGNTYTSSGTYSDTILSSTKFDSIITLNLTIKKPTFRCDTVNSCESYKWPINNITYNKSGIYFDTLVNKNGCDSIVSLNLSINYIVITSQKIVACNEYIWPVNNQKYTQTGEYKSVDKTIYGCDSIIFLRLIINHTTKPLPIAKINPDGLIKICEGDNVNLQAYKEDNYKYEWFKNNQIIVGATQSVYKASTTGFYTVKVTNDVCSTVSNSVPVTVTQYPSSDVTVSGSTTFCEGGSTTLTALGNGSFKWSNGVTSKSITVNKSGVYRVEITNNNCTSSSKDYSITVISLPTSIITPQGNTSFCQGGFVNLQATEGANYSYEWFNNSKLIVGATQSVYKASTNGFYTVKVKDGACSATSNSVPVTVTQYPSSDVTVSGSTTFCEGGSTTLTALGNGSFKWSNGVTSKSITVNKSGIYRVEVTNNNCTSSSKDYSITVNPNPIAKITPDGPTAFCEGGAVNLVASGGTTYKWNSGILTPSITVTKTGTYYVNVINSFGCSVYTSYDVNVYPNPTVSITPIAQFTLQNNSSIKLSATPAGGEFKGEGVTGTSFNPSNIGLGKKTIYYNYTSTQGCSGSAKLQTIVVDSIGTKCTSYDTVTITNTINDTVGILKIKFQLTTGIKANQFTSVSVYPNPTSDVLIIDASDVQALNGYRYKMIDISGKTVYNELVSAAKTEINLKALGAKGVYVLHIIDGKGTSIDSKKIVLE